MGWIVFAYVVPESNWPTLVLAAVAVGGAVATAAICRRSATIRDFGLGLVLGLGLVSVVPLLIGGPGARWRYRKLTPSRGSRLCADGRLLAVGVGVVSTGSSKPKRGALTCVTVKDRASRLGLD